MKRLFRLLILACIALPITFISCDSGSDDIDDPEGPTVCPNPDPKPKFYPAFSMWMSKPEVNLFERTKLAIYSDDLQGVNHLLQYYDSITWDIPGVYHKLSTFSSFLISTEQSFCLPGDYDIILSGYFDGVKIKSDTTRVKTFAKGDFLNIYWSDNEKFDDYYNSYWEDKEKGFNLNLKYFPDELAPYVILKYNPSGDYLRKMPRAKGYLGDYITKLYGTKKFSFDSEDISKTDLIDKYNERFVMALNNILGTANFYPVAIWDTPKSHIALIGLWDDGHALGYHYRVIAEPKKF